MEKSRNRTLPNYPLKNKVLSKEEWLLNLDRRELEARTKSVNSFIALLTLSSIQRERDAGYEAYLGSNCIGPTCAATVSDNYGLNFIGSLQFRDNHTKYGFKKIDNSLVEPGDIDVVDNVGRHTMMLDNKNNGLRFNHSNGGWYAENIRKNAKYPFRGLMESYTFVGTPNDSLLWLK